MRGAASVWFGGNIFCYFFFFFCGGAVLARSFGGFLLEKRLGRVVRRGKGLVGANHCWQQSGAVVLSSGFGLYQGRGLDSASQLCGCRHSLPFRTGLGLRRLGLHLVSA